MASRTCAKKKIVNIKISGFPSYWKKGCLQATLLVSLMLVFGTKLYYELSLLPLIQAVVFWVLRPSPKGSVK